MGNIRKHSEYKGNVIERYKQMKDDEVQMTQEIENCQNSLIKGFAEKEGIEIDKLMEDYAKEDNFHEYLVNGAILKCTQATLNDYPIPGREPIILSENVEDREITTLQVLENPMLTNGLRYATVRNTVMYQNITPFNCNCLLPIDKVEEIDKIMADTKCCVHGVCRHLMELSEEWDNMSIEGTYYLMRERSLVKGAGIAALLSVKETVIEEGITMTSVLFCKHGGIIYPETSGQNVIREEQLVTMKQMEAFGFQITEEELIELNHLMKQYGMEDRGSIALFLATCGHESEKGTKLMEDGDDAYWESHGYDRYTRGAGYIQVTGADQLNFYAFIGETPPKDRTKDIAENYAWEASIWEWAIDKKGEGVIMNDYVVEHGTSEEIFLITQYFINGYVIGRPDFDSDLKSIRKGGTYKIDYKAETLTVNGRVYRLPANYEKRKNNYDNAIKAFMEE